MQQDIVVSLVTVGGTALSAFGGVLVANKLANYRIEQLEKKVEKHNSLVERMTVAELKIGELEKRV